MNLALATRERVQRLVTLQSFPEPKVALLGQPNCGKSTVFNSVAGYRSEVSNFPGTTVTAAKSLVRFSGWTIELSDLPGIYSLTFCNPAETAAKEFLLSSPPDLIINVLDASLLERSLELTLELRELNIPMVVCLNMMDEARRKGIRIYRERLEAALQLPVAETVASQGEGIRELFTTVRRTLGRKAAPPPVLEWSRDVEQEIGALEAQLTQAPGDPPKRFVAVKLLEGDEAISARVHPAVVGMAARQRDRIAEQRGRDAQAVIMSERHDLAMRLSEEATTLGAPGPDVRDRIDRVLTHPLWGYLVLFGALAAFFWGVFGIGSVVERLVQARLVLAWQQVAGHLVPGTVTHAIVHSVWDGFAGGAGIVLPYLVPFLIGLAILEDIGYLPRVAYLMDGLLHRIGLHGTSTLPLVLGYGCSVPACLATRILPSRRDRFLASVLATLVPCSARCNVIFAMAGFYLGPVWAVAMFGVNALVVIGSGILLARAWPEISPGMILEVPRYQMPKPAMVLRKVWLRIREFVVLSWPLLMAGSVVLGLAEYWKWDHLIDLAFAPITRLLGLPLAVGTTLLFGILRKELSMVMLVQALGTSNVHQVMTATQIVVFTLFVTFYMPCLATIAALVREIGRKLTALAVAYTFTIATTLALAARVIGSVLVPGR